MITRKDDLALIFHFLHDQQYLLEIHNGRWGWANEHATNGHSKIQAFSLHDQKNEHHPLKHTYMILQFVASPIPSLSKKHSSGFREQSPEKWNTKGQWRNTTPRCSWECPPSLFTSSTSCRSLSALDLTETHMHVTTSRWEKSNYTRLIHRENYLILSKLADDHELGLGMYLFVHRLILRTSLLEIWLFLKMVKERALVYQS